MQVEIKKLTPSATIPKYAKAGDCGMDLTATSIEEVDGEDYGFLEYGTGLTVRIPDGHMGLIFPRSSVSKTGLFLNNCIGMIKENYTSELKLKFKRLPNTKTYEKGDCIGKIVFIPFPPTSNKEIKNLN